MQFIAYCALTGFCSVVASTFALNRVKKAIHGKHASEGGSYQIGYSFSPTGGLISLIEGESDRSGFHKAYVRTVIALSASWLVFLASLYFFVS